MSEATTPMPSSRHGWNAKLGLITAYAEGKPVWHWDGQQWRELGDTATFTDQWRNYRLDDPAQAERQRVIAEGIVAGNEIFGDGKKRTSLRAKQPKRNNQNEKTK